MRHGSGITMPVSLLPALLLLATAGCGARSQLDEGVDGGGAPLARDGGRDAGPTACAPLDTLDLLLVIDDSNSMQEEQASLAMQLPRLVRALSTGDSDGDGRMDFPPVADLHLGVVTSDMGTGGFEVPTCLEPNFGDDGVLRTSGSRVLPGCRRTYPHFLIFRVATGDDPDAFAADAACVAMAGTEGCGFEQPLEAALKAVTPSTSRIRFSMRTEGHADRENSGFLRADSLLSLVLISDEDDCSASDPELFDPGSPVYTGDLNLRCFQFPGAVFPVDRYVGGLRAARRRPDLLLFAAIVGVPARLVEDRARVDYDAILRDPDMQELVDPTMPSRLRPSCDLPGTGLATPPRRIVQLARALDARGSGAVVQSLCQPDFAGPVTAILSAVARRLQGECP